MHSLGRVLHFEETHTGRVSRHERAAYAGHAHDSAPLLTARRKAFSIKHQ